MKVVVEDPSGAPQELPNVGTTREWRRRARLSSVDRALACMGFQPASISCYVHTHTPLLPYQMHIHTAVSPPAFRVCTCYLPVWRAAWCQRLRTAWSARAV